MCKYIWWSWRMKDSEATWWARWPCWEVRSIHFCWSHGKTKRFFRSVSSATDPVSCSAHRPAAFLLCSTVSLYFHEGASNKPPWLWNICASKACVAFFLLTMFRCFYLRLDKSRSQADNTAERWQTSQLLILLANSVLTCRLQFVLFKHTRITAVKHKLSRLFCVSNCLLSWLDWCGLDTQFYFAVM